MTERRGNMLDSHDEVIALLSGAGVPASYRKAALSLSTYGPIGVGLKRWVDYEGAGDLAQGIGRHFIGNSPTAMDLFYMTAKGLALRAMAVKVISLQVIARTLHAEEFEDRVKSAQILFVPGFYNSHFRQPFNETQLYDMEWFFSQWLRMGRALVTQADKPLRQCAWWSPQFLQLGADHLPEVACS